MSPTSVVCVRRQVFFFSPFPEKTELKLCKPTGVSGSFWQLRHGGTLALHSSVPEPLSVSYLLEEQKRLGGLQVGVWPGRRLSPAGVSQGQRVPMCSSKGRRTGRDSVEISTRCSSICGHGSKRRGKQKGEKGGTGIAFGKTRQQQQACFRSAVLLGCLSYARDELQIKGLPA